MFSYTIGIHNKIPSLNTFFFCHSNNLTVGNYNQTRKEGQKIIIFYYYYYYWDDDERIKPNKKVSKKNLSLI